VKRFCDRAMMVKNGDIVMIDTPQRVAMEYAIENSPNTGSDARGGHEGKDVSIDDITLSGGNGGSNNHYLMNDDIHFTIKYTVRKSRDISLGMCLRRPDTSYLAGASSKINLGKLKADPGKHVLEGTIPASQLTEGVFFLNAAMLDYDNGSLIDYVDTTAGQEAPRIYVLERDENKDGDFSLQIEWKQSS
jgi:hypothetical protein